MVTSVGFIGVGTVKVSAGACDTLRFSATRRRSSSMPFSPRNEFQPRFELVPAVPRFIEDAENGFDGGKQLFFREKIGQNGRFGGQASQPADDENLEAAM